MAFTDDKMALDGLSLNDLRQLGRDEIEELVADGLLEEDRAGVIFSEDQQKMQEQNQSDALLRSQAQNKKEEQQKDDDWLQRMSQSYQKAYLQLMETYDNVETEYGTIKTRAEKLKVNLRENMKAAYRFGVPLSDGEVAFYDRKNNDFVDGTTLQALAGDDAKEAAEAFNQLSPRQQNANAAYVDASRAYGETDDVSRSADVASREVQSAKQAAENSDGALSEAELKNAEKSAIAKAADITARLDKTENASADFDSALSADTDDAVAPRNSTARPQGNAVSFASQVNPSAAATGEANGKTATSFNAAASSKPAGGDGQTIVSDNRIAPTSPVSVR